MANLTSAKSSRARILYTAVTGVVIAGCWGAIIVHSSQDERQWDLETYYYASRAHALGMDPYKLEWQEHRLVIPGKGGPYGKHSKRRVIPMTERVRRLIEYHFAEHNDIGMSGRTIQRIVKRVANRAGIAKPVSPHVLRHTFAVNCIKKGVSTRALQTLLGRDRLTTTELYLNLSPEDAIREFLEKW